MEWMKCILAVTVFLGYPLLPGSLSGYLCRKYPNKGLQQNIYLQGVLIYGALFGISAMLGAYKNLSVQLFSGITLLCSLALAALVAVCFVCIKAYRSYVLERVGVVFEWMCRKKLCKLNFIQFLPVAAYFMISFLYVVRPFPLETGYDTPERVVTMLQTGQMTGTNILTGEVTDEVLSLTETPMALPLLYTCLCTWFSLSPGKLMFEIIPFVVLFFVLQVVYAFGGCIWKEKKEAGNRAWFLFFFAFVTLCGNKAYMNVSYGLLHFPYEGKTLFSVGLLPLAFVTCMQELSGRRYADWAELLLLLVNSVLLVGPGKGVGIMLTEILVLLVSRLILDFWKGRGRLWK